MIQYGLLGEHLTHSFSPEIHAEIGDYPYVLIEKSAQALAAFLQQKEFSGINVTIPYKEAVIPYLDILSPQARQIGAVNTIVNQNGRLYGYNTDYFGVRALLSHAGVSMQGKKVLVLGDGGTAKTVRTVLRDSQAREIVTVSRQNKPSCVTYQEAYRLHGDAQIIINTTPCGMYPETDACPIDISLFPSLCGVIDVIYNPLQSRLVQSAKETGIPSEGGLYMLSSQAVYAAGFFFNREIQEEDTDRVYRAVLQKKQNTVLLGMPSCGKSTVGKILAEGLHRPFIDTDSLIEEQIGMPIASYIKKYGEPAFRDIEQEVIAQCAKQTACVIATGGGAVLRQENIRALRQNGMLFFLDRSLSLLTPTADRPLSQDSQALARRYAERYPLYVSRTDRTVSADGTPEEVADLILEMLS